MTRLKKEHTYSVVRLVNPSTKAHQKNRFTTQRAVVVAVFLALLSVGTPRCSLVSLVVFFSSSSSSFDVRISVIREKGIELHIECEHFEDPKYIKRKAIFKNLSRFSRLIVF